MRSEEIDFEYEHGEAHSLLASFGVAHGSLPERVEDLIERVEVAEAIIEAMDDCIREGVPNPKWGKMEEWKAFSVSECYRAGARHFRDKLDRIALQRHRRRYYEIAYVKCIGKWAGALFRARELVYEQRQKER